MKFLKLIRYQNLLMLAFMQVLFRYAFLKLQNIPLALADWQYGLLILSTVLIAAAGYVINNIMDVASDNINKPKDVVIGKGITETAAYNIYITLNITGVAIGCYLSNVIMRPSFAVLFILIATLLYFYATALKQIMVVGNIVVALLLASSVVIIGVFDLFPATNSENQAQMASFFSILTDYALFAFMINLIREIIKDIEDVDGDYNQGMNTLPIAIGNRRAAIVALGLAIFSFILLLLYCNKYFVENGLFFVTFYAFAFVLAPLLYFIVKIYSAKSKKDFHHLSTVLKLILLFGILSIAVITFNIHYNA
ncbi:geranylgeranylglycerol-phosphate geranylgeranyltransferase [Flavobacterium sp. Fl-77]|uniref:Geranylgeranylglycerol-phosphate geranylgeranyltransferase n=1 Tax=Flavobacterium flavipigmentatum TaxID=2893884 RepID=A0AAJ2VYN2_9FLAO|nr:MULTISPECIES: geranylgeranylglycerol-phosphate geranylgeranyltransferase [unclassified Flavobacterium]MDX6182966.1 geranylgeranylglycerol-phosphate geranylgeranyltransferase [Flavobacterium sp. Fl-33]MDX6186419.1 geranylgeranylglycerol-phosphate geranylgeranyltransferase [Flavobacterium sp. Fl-77]UFH37794.1 geranylgeranylglycerol-phosphate geranylgeranyltransferase [Flavobacterium sp. F-70]